MAKAKKGAASGAGKAPAARAAPRAKPAAQPTVLVVTPPGWTARTQGPNAGPQPFSIPLAALQQEAPKVPKKSKPKAPHTKPKPQPARRGPDWTLFVWIAAATCVILGALSLGDPERSGSVLGYLIVAAVLVALALHRPIGRLLRRALEPSGAKKARAKRARPRAR